MSGFWTFLSVYCTKMSGFRMPFKNRTIWQPVSCCIPIVKSRLIGHCYLVFRSPLYIQALKSAQLGSHPICLQYKMVDCFSPIEAKFHLKLSIQIAQTVSPLKIFYRLYKTFRYFFVPQYDHDLRRDFVQGRDRLPESDP